MAIEFITMRELENKAGEIKGTIRVAKLQEEQEALVEYTCPECGFAEKKKEAWQEPFVAGTGVNKKFLVKCKKCGHEIKFMKLKKEASKKNKQKK